MNKPGRRKLPGCPSPLAPRGPLALPSPRHLPPPILEPWFPCLCPNRASLDLRIRGRLSSSRRSRNSSPCLRSSVQLLQLREAGIWCQRTGLASGSPVSLPESQSSRPLGLVSAGIKVFPGITQSPPGLGRGQFCPCPTPLPPLTSARSPSTPVDRQPHRVTPAFIMWPVL